MVSSVDHSRTISRQLNGFDVFSPNDFRRDKGENTIRSTCISVDTVDGTVEATRWRTFSFVSIISLCYRGSTLEYDFGVFCCVCFFNGVCTVHVASMELPGGREDPDTKGRLRQHTPSQNKTKCLHASQGRSTLSPLSCRPWLLQRAIREAAHASRYLCARLHMFCDPHLFV